MYLRVANKPLPAAGEVIDDGAIVTPLVIAASSSPLSMPLDAMRTRRYTTRGMEKRDQYTMKERNE